jgi:O-antigen ligase
MTEDGRLKTKEEGLKTDDRMKMAKTELLMYQDTKRLAEQEGMKVSILYMVVVGFIWLLVWGSFSSGGPNRIFADGFPSSTYDLINGIRAYTPFLAIFLSVIFMMSRKRINVMSINKPVLFLILYGITGLCSSLLSPQGLNSANWGILFLAVPLTGWFITDYGDSMEKSKILLQANWIIAFLFVFYLSLGPLRPYFLGKPLPNCYFFEEGSNRITQNGVGRYAVVASLIALSRFRQQSSKRNRILWFFILAFSLNLLSISQSRTALLGFTGGIIIIFFSLKFQWVLFFAPVFALIIYLSGFLWAAHGTWQDMFDLTGRPLTWAKGLEVISQSPLIGFGFHADRFLMDWQHMHNAFLHSLIQSGILGAIFFIAAIYGIWGIILRKNLIKRAADISNPDNIILSEALAIVLFFTLRSFFESTAAFYGADLFFLVPALLYINAYAQKEEEGT